MYGVKGHCAQVALPTCCIYRYAQLSKTISDHKDEIKLLKDKEKDLRDTIRNLDKDILVG